MAFIGAYALSIHTTFLQAIPDPIFQVDSGSYLDPVLCRLYAGTFALTPARSAGYPLFLLLLLSLTKSLYAVLWVQHFLLLSTGLLAAFLYYRVFYPSIITATLVFFFVSISPTALISAHSIMTETVYTWMACWGTLLLFLCLEKYRIGLWILLGVTVSLAIWIRPVGWSLAVACLTGLAFHRPRLAAVRGFLSFALSTAILTGAISFYNLSHHGFFGLAQFTGLPLIGPTAHLLDVDRIPDPQLRQILTPFYRDQTMKLNDWDWVRYAPDGPVQAIARADTYRQRLDWTLADLARLAIRQHPVRFLREQAVLFSDFILHRSAIPSIYLLQDYTMFVYRGLGLVDPYLRAYPLARRLIRHDVRESIPYVTFARQLLHAKNQAEAERCLAHMQAVDIYHYSNVLALLRPLRALFDNWRWLCVCALVSILLLGLRSGRRSPPVILLVIITLNIVLANVADPDGRYALPIEPLYIVLFAAGMEFLVRNVTERMSPSERISR
jgi:hypothetical protein